MTAVNHSGDSDNSGPNTGNILGAILGLQAISNLCLEEFDSRDVLEQVATDKILGCRNDRN